MKPLCPNRRGQGFALILVLWIVSLLILMAGSFALSMRRETAIVANIKNTAQTVAIAESGIALAEMMLTLPDVNRRWRPDGSVYQIEAYDAEIRVRILAENGKIDINKADEKLLTGLLANAPSIGEKPVSNLASALLDWRDEDDLVHLDGAEKKEYQEAGLHYSPRNKPFQSIDELQLVLGMDKPTFEWLAPLVTIYSGQVRVNLPIASPDVLRAMPGLDPEIINDYLAARLQSAQQDLPPPPFPSEQAKAGQNSASPIITVISEAVLVDGTSAKISAVLLNSQNAKTPFQILDWRHDTLGDLSLFAESQPNYPAASEWIAKHYVEPELNR